MRTLLVLLMLSVVGCTLGPDYRRPDYPMPETHRTVEEEAPPTAEVSFGDLPWAAVYADPTLQALIVEAVKTNYDVRIATERIVRFRQQEIISRSFYYPTLDARAGFENIRTSREGFNPPQDSSGDLKFLEGSLSWEIDLFGRIRRSVEAARADTAAFEYDRASVLVALVNDLAQAYLELRLLDIQLDIARRTADSRRSSLDLIRNRFELGYDALTAVRMSENLLYTATLTIPDIQKNITFKEHQICGLLGRNPGPVERGTVPVGDAIALDTPPGLPSQLLWRRPDVLSAEQALIAANARIGEAEARRYPSINLTGVGGYESRDLAHLLDRNAGFWDIVAGISLPIFNAGRLKAGVTAAEAAQREAALGYARAIQQALLDVSNALTGVRRTREVRIEREKQTAALADQANLANMRYYGGETSYLEVLDSERQLFDAELSLVQARRDELTSVVTLYRALGGGWQQPGETTAATSEDTQGHGADSAGRT